MFVFLSKFLPLLVYPLGLACVLIVFALIIKKPILRKVATWLALIVLFIGGNRWVAMSLTRSLEQQYLPPMSYPTVDMIVVLGGGTESFGSPRSGVEINGAGDRLLQAARLYRQGVAPTILASGGNITWLGGRPSTPAAEMRDILMFLGIPEDAILLQPDSQNTYEDALYSSKMLDDLGINKIVLVTSASHMPRSVALFEAQGLEVIPSPADYSVPDYAWNDLWQGDIPSQLINLIPNAGSLSQTTSSLKEYIGLLVYRMRGWL